MTSHDACTSGTSGVLTVASLQRWKMEALIPAPAYCEVQSMIKRLHAQSSADRNLSSAVPGLWPHTARRWTQLVQEFGWESLNHHPLYSPDLAPSDFHIFLHLKKFLSAQLQHFQNDREAEMSGTVVPIPGWRLLRHRIQTLFTRYDRCLKSGGEYVEKIAQYLPYVF